MIWPGRAAGDRRCWSPRCCRWACSSTEALWPAVAGARRGDRRWWRWLDLATLIGAGAVPGRAAVRRGRLAGRAAGGRADDREPRPARPAAPGPRRRARDLRRRAAEFLVSDARPRAWPSLGVHGRRPGGAGRTRFERVDALVSSRLGLWQRSVAWPVATEVRVYPDVRQIARYTVLARRDKLSTLGVRRSRRLGTDNEFERLRDYTEGDEPRHMDWRATARRRKLTVRAHQVNQSQRLIFLIDCGRMMAGDTGGGLSPLDHAFNAMLMLAHVALIRGDQVGLLAFSDRVRAYVPPGGGPRRINRLVHASTTSSPSWSSPGTTGRSSSWRSGAASGRWSS